MAWNISKAKRQALVKLQLRDKDGRFIEMGGGVKWYSSRLKKEVAGTVVGSRGGNALVRLNKENPTHEPALVSVPAASIEVVDSKATLSPKGEPSADETPEFEKPEAVADVKADPNAEAESDHESQLKGPQHLAANYGIAETSDGNTYITRKDGESIYSPARSLKVGDEIIAPAGADPTKPFSIGRNWATKGTERLNKEGEGPVIGKVIAISENRYAVVQMAGGHTIADRRNPEEQTDTVTVGLSNQVILATMGLKDALGDRVSSQTYAERPSDEEKEVAPDAPEAQSDHEGREVPEDQVDAESDTPRRLQILRDMPVGGRVMSTDGMQTFEKRNSNQWALISGDGELITDEDVMGMVEQGEARGMSYGAQEPADGENAPESAPGASEAPEAQPVPESPAEEAPEAVEETPDAEAPVEDVPEEPAEAKATPVNDIVEGLAELEQAAEDIEDSGLDDEEADDVLNGASFSVVANDGKKLNVTAEKDENGDWNFVVADENGAEVASHVIGSEENRVLAEKIAKGSAAPAKDEAAPEADAPTAPEAEVYDENGLTEEEAKEVAAAMRMANRAYDRFDDDAGDRYAAMADSIMKRGEERKESQPAQNTAPITGPTDAEKIANAERMYGTGSPQHKEAQRRWGTSEAEAPAPAETPAKASESTPDAPKVDEPEPADSKPSDDNEAAPKSDAQKRFESFQEDVQAARDEDGNILSDDPRRIAADSADQNAQDSVNEGSVEKYSDEWYDIWNSTYGSALEENSQATPQPEDAPEPDAAPAPDAAPETDAGPVSGKFGGLRFERASSGLQQAIVDMPELMTPEEKSEFDRLNNSLAMAQHNNHSVRERTARDDLAKLVDQIDGRIAADAQSPDESDGSGEGSSDNTSGPAPEAAPKGTPEPENAPESAPQPEATPEKAPEGPETSRDSEEYPAPLTDEEMGQLRERLYGPSINEDGLLPDEAARLSDLETRVKNSYSPNHPSDEPVEPLEREINELLEHGEVRNRGESVDPFVATDPAPDHNPAPEAVPEPESAPEVAPEAPAAPEIDPATPATPRTRARRGEAVPVADADGNMITRGDMIGHPTLGPVEIVNTIPGSGRVEFIDPNTGRKKSVKAANVRRIDPNAATPETAPEAESTTVSPGDKFIDAATGKKGFGDKNGNRVLVGDRVTDANGNEGTVISVYTAANGGAWIPVKWDSDGRTRRVMGAQLTKSDSSTPDTSRSSDDSRSTPSAPEPTPEAAPEAAPEAPSAPEAPATPEATPVEETHEEATARRQALADSIPVGSQIVSDDGSQHFYKVSDTQWQFNEGSLLTPTAVVNMMALGERRDMKYSGAEGGPAEVNKPVVETPAVDAPQAPAGTALAPEERERRIGMLRALPTGTTVRPRSGEYTLTKDGSDNWSSTVDDGVYDTEDVYGIVESGRAGGLLYEVTRPTAPAPAPEPESVALDADSLVPPTVASRLEAFRRAPIGTTVTSPAGTTTYTKAGDDEWTNPDISGATIKNSTLAIATDSDNGYWVFNKTGPAEPEGTNVTAMPATEKLRAFRMAPIGSKLVSTNGKVITKTGERLWVTDNGTEYTPADLVFVTAPAQSDISGPFGLVLPEAGAVDPTPTPRPIPQDLGSRIRVSEEAPIGTIVTSSTGESYTKINDREWADTATRNFKYGVGEFASKLKNNEYTGDYFVQGFDVPDITPEAAPEPTGDRPRQIIPVDPISRINYIQDAPVGATVFHAAGRVLEKKGPNRWEDQTTGEDLTDLDVYTKAASLDGWYATLPPEPEAEPVPVINPQLPVGAFVPSAAGSTSGVKRVGDDKWEMIKDGEPTGRFVNDEAVSVIQELVGTDVDIPVDPRFGESVGMYADDLKLPGGKSLGEFVAGGGSFSSLTGPQRQAIQAGYDKFIENLNSKLPRGFKAKMDRPISFNGSIMTTKVAFYQGNRKLGAATRHFMPSTDSRTGQRMSGVEHAYFTLTDATQGSGVSSAFLNASKQMYRQMGLDRISIHADISVGGYAWARGGFDFSSASSMRDAIYEWEQRMNWNIPAGREEEWREGLLKFRELKARATSANFQNKTHPAAIEFANIGRPEGPTSSTDTWFGKAMMLGSDWYGEFPLNPNG